MATRAATAIRTETATGRIVSAAKRIGIEPAELRTSARTPEEKLADVVERVAAMMEAAADVIEGLAAQPAKAEKPEPKAEPKPEPAKTQTKGEAKSK